MEHHVEVPEQSEQVAPEEVGVGPGRRVLAGIRRPFAAVGRRVIRFLFDRQVMANAVDRRLAVSERFGLLEEEFFRAAGDFEGRLTQTSARLDDLAKRLGRLDSDTSGQVASLAVDQVRVSEAITSALEGIRELQRLSNDERGRLDSLSADLAGVAATVASRTRAIPADAPLTDEAKAWIKSVSSVWPETALEAYAQAQQTLEVDFGRDPELPVPPETVAELLASVCLDGGSPDDIEAYLQDSHWRFLHTLELVGPERVRTLELGANPYFTTVLFWEYRDEEPELANYFGFDDKEVDTQVVEYIDAEGVQKKRTVGFRLFNIERDRFPYEDESFGMVLFCEILEHLTVDPFAGLSEINRVTEMGGHLVLTTPNVARTENVARLLSGDNLYDPYSGHGPYGRHNREYTLDELGQLLAFSGYTIDCGYSADAHPWSPDISRLEMIRPELRARLGDLGQYLFVSAVKTGLPREERPDFLYRSMFDEELFTPGAESNGGPST